MLRLHAQELDQSIQNFRELQFVADSYVDRLIDGKAVLRAKGNTSGYQDFIFVWHISH